MPEENKKDTTQETENKEEIKPSGGENNQSKGEECLKALKDALKEVLDEKNSDLVLVKRDCPYIPIRSLNGRDGSIYGDGETIYLSKLGKTFKVLGSFHIVRDSDLNLATCYVLGLDNEPSLILPDVILQQLQGGG